MNSEHSKIHVFDIDSESTGWGGFDFDNKIERPFGEFLKELWTKEQEQRILTAQNDDHGDGNHPVDVDDPDDVYVPPIQYGFDYRIACNCPKLLDRFPQLSYFQGDVLALNPSFSRVHWPVFIVGPATSYSSLHVDSHYLPFYLTLLSGRKKFRIIKLNEWKTTLVPDLFDEDGHVTRPIHVYDDDVARSEILERGANIYNVTLEIGDTIYIPTGALHGAYNMKASTTTRKKKKKNRKKRLKNNNFIGDLSISYSSNFLDLEHSKQIKKEWCKEKGATSSAICHLLMNNKMKASNKLFKNIVQKLNTWKKEKAKKQTTTISLKKKIHQFSYWPWMLSHSGYCLKNAIDTCPGISDRCAEHDDEE